MREVLHQRAGMEIKSAKRDWDTNNASLSFSTLLSLLLRFLSSTGPSSTHRNPPASSPFVPSAVLPGDHHHRRFHRKTHTPSMRRTTIVPPSSFPLRHTHAHREDADNLDTVLMLVTTVKTITKMKVTTIALIER